MRSPRRPHEVRGSLAALNDTAMFMLIRSWHTCALVGALLLALPAAAAEAQSARPQATAAARTPPLSAVGRSASVLRDSLVALARAQIGKPYRFGGRSPKRGFDCSGFVQYILAALEHEVPRTAAQQAGVGEAVARDTSRLRPGDLLTFGDDRRITHIGIYVGNGRFIHASSGAGRVIESPILRRMSRVQRWRGVRRLALEEAVEPTPVVAYFGPYGAVPLSLGGDQ